MSRYGNPRQSASASTTLFWASIAIAVFLAEQPSITPGLAADGKESAPPRASSGAILPAIAPRPLKPGLDRRVPWTASRVVGSPDPPFPFRYKRAYPNLKLDRPVSMVPEPGTRRIFVAIHDKTAVAAFEDDPACKAFTEILKVPIPAKEAAELYSLIVHPNYLKNREIFLFVNVRDKDEPTPAEKKAKEGAKKPKNKDKIFDRHARDQILRFRVSDRPPFAILPESKQLIIEWPSSGHDGGDMGFGPDGYLYITAGDGTTGSDPDISGQDLTDLRSSILRIDVDHPESGKSYRIPPDNPFLKIPAARPEIWAFGLRAPWRMSFDPPTGNLWVGEVGQDLWEMIHLVKRGGNYGWSVMEGTHPFFPERRLGPAPISPPIVEHHHSEARSITGGYVYHGKRLPELADHYLYCCYQTGTVWGFRYAGGKVLDHRVLADSTYNCATWGHDHAGEMYLVALTGEIFELERNPAALAGGPRFPQRLSETGIFQSVRDQRPMPGVLSYEVNAPVWHDGASYRRFLAIPGTDTINPTTSRGWEFMDGAVLAQTLSLEMEEGRPASRKNIETRLMTRQGGEWFGYTYEWNDQQTDAQLVGKEGKDRKLAVRDVAAPGGRRQRTWHIPSRSECMFCHSRAANFVLGLNTLQMNRTHAFERRSDNQIRTLDLVGYFTPHAAPDREQKLVDPYDDTASLDARARSYLHANCSQCHVADGGGNARMELEFTNAINKTNTVGVTPLQGKFDIADGELIAAGDPCRSVLYYRLSKIGGGRMPQVGSSEVDERALAMFYDWIKSMPASEADLAVKSRLEAQRQTDQAAIESLVGGGAVSGSNDALDRLLATTSGALRLLRAVHERQFDSSTRAQIIAVAAVHPNPTVRDLFERFLPEEKRIRRLGPSINAAQLLALRGDAGRGRNLFFKTSGIVCQSCHRINAEGKDVGPDLSHVGKKLNRAQLLENLVDPSKTIEDKYVSYVLESADGRTVTGVLAERTLTSIAIKDAQGNLTRVSNKDVEALLPQKKSLMPEFLLRDLTAEQAADLLAYLESLK